MRLPIRTTTFNTPIGRWSAVGKLEWVTPIDNPRKEWQRAYGGRLFVGLYVNGKPRWKEKQVIDLVKKHWIGGASVLKQAGIWVPAEGKAQEEKSVQVVLLSDGKDWKSLNQFSAAIFDLGDVLVSKLKQSVVLYEIQQNGITKGAGEITP